MNVICPSCSTVYRVDPAKVPEKGVRARCRVCAAIFQVPAMAEGPPQVAPEPAREKVPTGDHDALAAAATIGGAPRPEPAAVAPVSHGSTVEAASPAASFPSPEPTAPVQRTTSPRFAPPAGSPRPSVAIPPIVSPAARFGASEVARPPAAVPPATPRPAAPPAAPAPAARRLVNPFMSQDPQQKARRLARALISDLVVYYPDRRQEGLRKGNLKEIFGEEIKKSWEEYRDQVGKEIAESTNYFNDALNDILAGGQKIW